MNKSLNKFVKVAAERLHNCIQDQEKWLVEQNQLVDEFIITGVNRKNSFDLRQSIQALSTGKQTKEILLQKFEQEIGITYDDYCKGIEKPELAVKSETEMLAERLAKFLKELV